MVKFTIFAGGYFANITSYLFDTDVRSLTVLNSSPTGGNPSWITLHPTNRSILYAVNENTQGAVQSFLIQQNGILSSALNTASSGGNGPPYLLPMSTGQVAVVNYGSGTARILPTYDYGINFDASYSASPIITFPIPSRGPSHPHMAYEYGKELFIPDLGADTIYRLIEDGSPGNWKIHASVMQPVNSGPRHMTIYNRILYTIHELSSTLTSQHIPILPANSSCLISNSSILPLGLPQGASMAAAEILIPPPSKSFPGSYIYVSNRNVGVQDPRGDSIAIFSFHPETGKVKLVNQIFTGLDQIRGMEFGGENDRYLIAAGVVGTGGVVIYERVDGGGSMNEVVRNTVIPTATSFIWT